MSARRYPCCEHCADDQPHIAADTHDVPCDIGGCQVWSEADARAEIDRLRAEVARLSGCKEQWLLAEQEVARLTVERDALRPQAAIGARAQRIAENVRPEYGDNCGHERAAWVDGYNDALDNVLAGAPVSGDGEQP